MTRSLAATARSAGVAALAGLSLVPCGGAQQIGARQITELTPALAELDAAFAEGDVDGYLAAFEPDHPRTHAMLAQRLQLVFPQLVAARKSFTRKSAIIGSPRRVGPRTVVRVRHELFADGEPVKADLDDSIVAFRTDGRGAPVPTFILETPRQIACPPGDVFRCPPCNYEIGGVPGWLCVPTGRDRSQSLEASSFYLLGADLACDVSVRIDYCDRSSIQRVEDLAAALRAVAPKARAGLAVSWLPESHAEKAPPDLEGARIEISVPSPDGEQADVVLLHVVQLGALQHLLFARGSRRAVAEHRAKLDALLASFRVIDADAGRAAASARAMRYHVGGEVDGANYENTKYGVGMTGPEGWTVKQFCGGVAFRVSWNAPSGATLWLTGYAVPAGMSYWCEQTANHFLEKLCKERRLSMPKQPPGWKPDASCAAVARTLKCEVEPDPETGDVATRKQRLLRVLFRDDVLVVADGLADDEQDWGAIKAAFATLRM